MRRLLVLITVLCLVAVASAQGETRLQTNKVAAGRDAQALVASLRLPSGTTRLAARRPTISSFGVNDHAKWTSGESQQAIVDYIKGHEPAGAKLESSGTSSGPGILGTELNLVYDWPSVGLELYNRTLSISVDALAQGGSKVFATSQTYWIVPRPASEQVPSGVRVVDMTLRVGGGSFGTKHPVTTTHVFTRAAVVDSLITRIDALPTVQPGQIYACPLELAGPEAPLLTLTFRSRAAAPELARAQVRVSPGRGGASGWTSCDPINFWIGSRTQTPLTSHRFVKQIGKLIGANIS